MREINLTALLPDVVLRFKRDQNSASVPIFLTLPPDLPAFTWRNDGLEVLLSNLFNSAISGHPERRIRVAVAKRKAMTDLEALVDVHPSCWIQLRMDIESIFGFDDTIMKKMGESGFRVEGEWVLEGARHKLIAYNQHNDTGPRIFCWIQHNKASHRYTILIPIGIE